MSEKRDPPPPWGASGFGSSGAAAEHLRRRELTTRPTYIDRSAHEQIVREQKRQDTERRAISDLRKALASPSGVPEYPHNQPR